MQAAPDYLDKAATIDKACSLIGEAASNEAKLIVFPETYIPGYPAWPQEWRERSFRAWVQLHKNSVEIPSQDTAVLGEAARRAGAYVVMGLNERSGGTLYNTALFLSKDGSILGRHRKLVPTHYERAVWGMGDGSDLVVCDTELGKVGALICGEHFMTLSRYALISMGEQIHASMWPGVVGVIPTLDTLSKAHALESQGFVIIASGYLTKDHVPDSFELKEHTRWECRGGSGIISPRGDYLAGPVYDKETIVYADIDMEMILWAKSIVDSVGHYARPDVASLHLNLKKQSPVTFTYDEPKRAEAEAALGEDVFRLTRKIGEVVEAEVRKAMQEVSRRIDQWRSQEHKSKGSA